MTLREESGNGPPGDREVGADPQEPVDPQEPADPQEPVVAAADPGDHASLGEPDPETTLPLPDGPDHPASPVSLADSRSPVGRGGPAGRRRSRAALLVGGSLVVCLVGLGGFAAFLLQHGRAHPPRAVLPPVFRLSVGECVNSGPGSISAPTVVPCARPHDAEIYARFGLAGRRWPGTAAIGAQARAGCTARLSGYLNPQLATSVLAESYVFPDRGAWNAGVRTVICEIRGTAGKLTGSVRGLG